MNAYRLLLVFLISVAACYGQSENQNLSNGTVFDGEPYLAINPSNSQHIVVAWMGWVNFSNQIKIKVKASFDAGQTWSDVAELPHVVSDYTSADPSIDFNQNGDVYICYIDFTGTEPPVTGGVYLCKSTDGGLSWEPPSEVITTNYDVPKWPIDRPWMAIDRSGGPNQGNIYITTMNLNRLNAPFNPYLSISSDGGSTFSTTYIDTVGWLAGGINPLPMCSPAINSQGVFFGSYPSYNFSQNIYFQYFIVSSNDGGASFAYDDLLTFNPPSNVSDYPFAKKAPLFIADPSDPDHLAFLYLSAINGDLDVFLTETTDAGISWTSPVRINDDPVGNGRMQDLIWGDFDNDGDLIMSWRDRRNSPDSTYQTESEIWAAYRDKDSLDFAPNFQITNQTVAYDSILENAGNDFMSIKMQNDTINAAWGDTRDGNLNIWFQSMTVDGAVLSIRQISSEEIPSISIYPNPTTSLVAIRGEKLKRVVVYDLNGNKLLSKLSENGDNRIEINLENYSSGTYLFEVFAGGKIATNKVIKR